MSSWQADVLAASVAAISIGAGTVLLVRRYGPERRPRALVEWTVFLGFLDGLILFAAFVVPWAIGGIIIRLIS